MPLREYKCEKCGAVDERLLRTPRTRNNDPCPKCGGKCSKIMSVVGGFEFKGSGFYATDYKGKK